MHLNNKHPFLPENTDFIELLKKADQEAFAQLVVEYQDHVFNTAISIVQHIQDAEDLTQEVFVQVFKSVKEFRGDAKLSTWIYRIALTKALEWERKKKAKKAISYFKNLVGLENNEQEVVDFYHPGIALDNKESAAVLFKALQSLPSNQKIAFVLIKVEGLSYQEVSAIMKKNVKSIEGLIQRAKSNLRQVLEKQYSK